MASICVVNSWTLAPKHTNIQVSSSQEKTSHIATTFTRSKPCSQLHTIQYDHTNYGASCRTILTCTCIRRIKHLWSAVNCSHKPHHARDAFFKITISTLWHNIMLLTCVCKQTSFTNIGYIDTASGHSASVGSRSLFAILGQEKN